MRVQKKRRKQNKTDYKLRIGLLKSSIPRIVIRKTNKYLIVQAVETEEAKDKIINGINSKDLLKNGWDKKLEGSLKSMPAAYLTGLLMAKKTGKGNFILDIGMAKHLKGSRICAVAKGLVDGGLNININPNVFPDESRLYGENLKKEIKPMVIKMIKELKWAMKK